MKMSLQIYSDIFFVDLVEMAIDRSVFSPSKKKRLRTNWEIYIQFCLLIDTKKYIQFRIITEGSMTFAALYLLARMHFCCRQGQFTVQGRSYLYSVQSTVHPHSFSIISKKFWKQANARQTHSFSSS